MRLFWPFLTAIILLVLIAIFLFPQSALRLTGNILPGDQVPAAEQKAPATVGQAFRGPTGQPFVNGPSGPPPSPPDTPTP